MTKSEHGYGRFILLSLLLLLPSIDTSYKYFAWTGTIVYLVVGFLFLHIVTFRVAPAVENRLPIPVLNFTAIAVFAGLIAIGFVGYSLATSGLYGGGSDADDALIIAANEFIAGRYPYQLRTYLGNGISPMPGAVFLSMPFTLTGLITLQNIFWIGVIYFLLRRIRDGEYTATSYILLLLIVSPTVLQNVVSGADYVSNSSYIAAAIWLMALSIRDAFLPAWRWIAAAVLFGFALSSRSNFLVLLPLIFSLLWQTGGFRPAFKIYVVAGLVCLGVTLPFYLYDPANFSPITVQVDKMTQIATVLPFAGVIIPLSGLIAATYFSFRRYTLNDPVFWMNCALVQLLVLAITTIVYSIKLGKPDLFVGQSGYGMFTVVFAAIAFVLTYFRRDRATDLIETF